MYACAIHLVQYCHYDIGICVYYSSFKTFRLKKTDLVPYTVHYSCFVVIQVCCFCGLLPHHESFSVNICRR